MSLLLRGSRRVLLASVLTAVSTVGAVTALGDAHMPPYAGKRVNPDVQQVQQRARTEAYLQASFQAGHHSTPNGQWTVLIDEVGVVGPQVFEGGGRATGYYTLKKMTGRNAGRKIWGLGDIYFNKIDGVYTVDHKRTWWGEDDHTTLGGQGGGHF